MASEPCPECGEVKANSGALRMHRIAKHQIAAGECPYCGKHYLNLPAHKCKRSPELVADAARGAAILRDAELQGRPPEPGPDPEPATAETAPHVGPIYTDGNGTSTGAGATRMERLRAKLWDRPAKADKAPASGPEGADVYKGAERAPKVGKAAGARKSAAGVLGTIWGGLGTALVQTGADVPVGRVLQFQAESAGYTLDNLFARTFIDRWVLQKVATREDDARDALALVGLPAAVALYERSGDEARRTIEPIMRYMVNAAILSMGPAIKARQADEKRMAATIAELVRQGVLPPEVTQPGADGKVDPSGAVLDLIFSPPPGMAPQPEPAHEPAPTG